MPSDNQRPVRLHRAKGGAYTATLATSDPVDMGGWRQSLECSPAAIDLSRFPLPCLVGHDNTTVPVGRWESPRLDGGRLRATLRWGESAAARDLRADVDSGVIRDVSIGYVVLDATDDEPQRVTRWRPEETSLVAIPADRNAGFGRSFNHQRTSTMTTPNNAARAVERTYERAREHGITAVLVDDYHREHDSAGKSAGAIEGEFNSWLADELGARARLYRERAERAESGHKPININDLAAPAINRGAGSDYSLVRAVARAVERGHVDGLEGEVSAELATRSGRKPMGFLMPASGWGQRAVTTAAGGGAGLHGIEHSSDMIDLLRARTITGELGVQLISTQMDTDFPALTAGNSAIWNSGENVEVAESAPATGKREARFHNLTAWLRFTRKMAVQANPAMEPLMRQDILRQIGIALDKAAIAGAGGVTAEPLGIIGTTGVGFVDTSAGLTWAKVLELANSVESENVEPGSFGWAGDFATKLALMTKSKGTNEDAQFILSDAPKATLAGYRAEFSGVVPASTLVFGAWQHLMAIQFGGLDMVVDPYSEVTKGNIRIAAHTAWDFVLRHPESFAYCDGTDGE